MTPRAELQFELVKLDAMIAGLLCKRHELQTGPFEIVWEVESELADLRCRRVQLVAWLDDGRKVEN